MRPLNNMIQMCICKVIIMFDTGWYGANEVKINNEDIYFILPHPKLQFKQKVVCIY